MNQYPEVVAKIVNDYQERMKSQLRLVPARERDDFLQEIQSHVYEAYMLIPGEDDVAKILTVLGKLGEPADVVSDRLPGAMMRSGTKRNLPVYIVGGILLALFGVPLGFGGFGVLLGLLCALAGVLAAYYVVAGSFFLSGAIVVLCGLTRIVTPETWDRLITLGLIQVGGPFAFLERLSPSDEGLIFIMLGSAFFAAGWGLLRLGKKLFHGLRFLFKLTFDWIQRFMQSVRQRLRQHDPAESPAGEFAFATRQKY
jgi:uncharacterized membrane protein